MTHIRISPTSQKDGFHVINWLTYEPVVLVVRDDHQADSTLDAICQYIGIRIEQISSYDDLAACLRIHYPMAVVAEMDAPGQDGCRVLVTVAEFDRELSVLLIVGDDPILLGTINAIEELWCVKAVAKWPSVPGAADLVDFLFRAGQSRHCLRLMPV
jgi:ActR/RegA family two-component response regulator